MSLDLFKMNILYDYYGSLLTDKQREIFKMHYLNDYSLGEISQSLNISRQGVYDTLKRAEATLKFYEEKLELIKKHDIFTKNTDKINELLDNLYLHVQSEEISKMIQEIKTILNELNQ
jgi:hypothetical protein